VRDFLEDRKDMPILSSGRFMGWSWVYPGCRTDSVLCDVFKCNERYNKYL